MARHQRGHSVTAAFRGYCCACGKRYRRGSRIHRLPAGWCCARCYSYTTVAGGQRLPVLGSWDRTADGQPLGKGT